MRDLALIAACGALGAVARFGVSGWVFRLTGERYAWGTLAVNVLGSFALGLLMELSLTSDVVPRSARVGITVGFLGAFTTFSTFSYETVRYMEDGAWSVVFAHIGANVVLAMTAAWMGVGLARMWMGGA